MTQTVPLSHPLLIWGNSLSGTSRAQNPHNQLIMKIVYFHYLLVYSAVEVTIERLNGEIKKIKEEDIPLPGAEKSVRDKFREDLNQKIQPFREIYQKNISELNRLEQSMIVLQNQQQIEQLPCNFSRDVVKALSDQRRLIV